MLDKLKRWYELLGVSGKNTKTQVRKEIEETIKLYQSKEEVSNGKTKEI